MTDDTARRERAEKWAKSLLAKMKAEDWGWRSEEAQLSFAYLAGAREEASRAAEKLRAAARETRTPFGEALAHLADEIEEGR